MGRITSIDIILENSTSFNNNFKTLTAILNTSVGQCFQDDKIYLPDFLTHAEECSCSYCTNSYLQDFHIQLYLQYIDSRKSFHDAKLLDINTYREAIDSLTSNASLRFQANLLIVKELLGYKDEKEAAPKKKGRKTKKATEKEAIPTNENLKFSKYIAEARMLGEHGVKQSMKMISNIEQLISNLETNTSLATASHELQRLIAQLYYLRSLLHVGQNKVVPQEELRNELSFPSKAVARKTRGKPVTTKRKGTNRRKKVQDDMDEEDGEIQGKFAKLTLKEETPTQKIIEFNDTFLEDLKKVLVLLNPFTDTLIIKSIYQLMTFVAASKDPHLALSTQLLASSRTLHQQILNAIGKKLRFALCYIKSTKNTCFFNK